jgi:hypothetical protein
MDRLDKTIVAMGVLVAFFAAFEVYQVIRTWHPPHACARIAGAIDIGGDCRR